MKCERCGADAPIERHHVDGFTGRLCEECAAVWEEIQGET